MSAVELDLSGALQRECPSCTQPSPLSSSCCDHCGQVFQIEQERVGLDFKAEDVSEQSDDYVPVHKSSNLLALREAVEEFRADELDSETYLEVIQDIQLSVKPLLDRFENQAKLAGDKMPEEHAWIFTEGLRVYRDYYSAMETMKSEPERGLGLVEVALKQLDEMERRL